MRHFSKKKLYLYIDRYILSNIMSAIYFWSIIILFNTSLRIIESMWLRKKGISLAPGWQSESQWPFISSWRTCPSQWCLTEMTDSLLAQILFWSNQWQLMRVNVFMRQGQLHVHCWGMWRIAPFFRTHQVHTQTNTLTQEGQVLTGPNAGAH